jgi:hypothetical protein
VEIYIISEKLGFIGTKWKLIGEKVKYIGETKIRTKKGEKNAGQLKTVRHKRINVDQMFYNLFLSGILLFYQCG